MDSFFFISICLIIGACTGFLSGLLGIGGGVIVVPALISLFDSMDLIPASEFPGNTSTLLAVGTSLATIIFTSSSAAITQMRRKMVEWRVVEHWGPFLVVGSFAASFIAAALPGSILRLFIGIFILGIAAVMLTRWVPQAHRELPGRWISGLVATFGGVVAGIAGVGAANFAVPTLVFFNVPILRATATASALGFVIAIFGTAGYVLRTSIDVPYTWGYVYLPAVAAIVTTSMFCAPIGVGYAHRIPAASLRKTFGLLMIVVAGRMAYSAFA